MTKQQQLLYIHIWHMWEYTSDHAQVTADEYGQKSQTYVHLLGTRSNVPILMRFTQCTWLCK